VDSMICVWGIKKEAIEEQKHMIPRTEAFLDFLDESGKKILLPAPVIAEILTPVDDEERKSEIIELINRRFVVGSLDAMASIKAAEIANKKNDWKEVYTEGETFHRNRFKFDTLIVATAITKGAEVLYTHDSKFRNLASEYLECRDLPSIAIQGKLF